LLVSILDGKSQDMPSFRGKINQDEARELVALVRVFAPTKGKHGVEKQQEPASPGDFEKEFRRLQEEMDELNRGSRKFSESSADSKRSEPSEASPRSPSSKLAESSPHSTPSKPSSPAAASTPDDRELFRQHCVRCHGADGTGSEARRRLPKIPNFTDTSWQARRSDAQLLASVRNGKGKKMPSGRGKFSEEQARRLVGHVRAFAPDAENPSQEEYEQPTPSEAEAYAEPTAIEPADPKQPRDFLGRLIRWLGRFHPAAVHFPVALLTAAAVAELLRLATGKSAFDAASRFCIWFGALAAVVAGVLGWFCGDLRLTDASWVLMTHRWVGTSAVAGAGLLLVLGEGSRRPDRRRTRMMFRVALFVVAALVGVTGFFGGAVVFGLDHYTWPP
jgi:uncharacterized membrane protein/mono/diheme cytochrome c family protein